VPAATTWVGSWACTAPPPPPRTTCLGAVPAWVHCTCLPGCLGHRSPPAWVVPICVPTTATVDTTCLGSIFLPPAWRGGSTCWVCLDLWRLAYLLDPAPPAPPACPAWLSGFLPACHCLPAGSACLPAAAACLLAPCLPAGFPACLPAWVLPACLPGPPGRVWFLGWVCLPPAPGFCLLLLVLLPACHLPGSAWVLPGFTPACLPATAGSACWVLPAPPAEGFTADACHHCQFWVGPGSHLCLPACLGSPATWESFPGCLHLPAWVGATAPATTWAPACLPACLGSPGSCLGGSCACRRGWVPAWVCTPACTWVGGCHLPACCYCSLPACLPACHLPACLPAPASHWVGLEVTCCLGYWEGPTTPPAPAACLVPTTACWVTWMHRFSPACQFCLGGDLGSTNLGPACLHTCLGSPAVLLTAVLGSANTCLLGSAAAWISGFCLCHHTAQGTATTCLPHWFWFLPACLPPACLGSACLHCHAPACLLTCCSFLPPACHCLPPAPACLPACLGLPAGPACLPAWVLHWVWVPAVPAPGSPATHALRAGQRVSW